MADYFAESLPTDTIPMSALQTHLVRHADSADDAVKRLDELLALANLVAAEAIEREECEESGDDEVAEEAELEVS